MSEKQEDGRSEGGSDQTWDVWLPLYQYFEDHGDGDKSRMITVVTWILGFGVAILGYIAKEHFGFESGFCVENVQSAWVSSGFGLAVSGFAAGMVLFFSRQANGNFKFAEKCAEKLPPEMKSLIDPGKRTCDGKLQFIRFGQQRCENSPSSWVFGEMVGHIFTVYFALSCFLAFFFAVIFVLSFSVGSEGVLARCPDVSSVGPAAP